MLTKPLLELLYESAFMKRWNDHIHPQGGFTELDKQAHKMVIAFVLAKFEEEERGARIEWRKLIEGGFYELLHRIVLTDIKPPVYYTLMETHEKDLNEWVLAQLEGRNCINAEFYDGFERYLNDSQYCALEKKILNAAHFLATNWEFQIIKKFNSDIFDLKDTETRIDDQLRTHSQLAGVLKVVTDSNIKRFINMVGQLRFQQRWAQSPRVPETSVLGHMLIVAILAYLCSIDIAACDQRACNNYLAGLFHDLPEVLTRDIISPVKSSVEGLDKLIKDMEGKLLEENLFPLLPAAWHDQMRYYLENEFDNKIMLDGQVKRRIKAREISKLYNKDEFFAVDGELIKGCDHLAAYIEAALSIRCGITSRHLQEGARSLAQKYENKKIAGVDFGLLFSYFS